MVENKYTNVKIEKETYLKIKNLSRKEGVSMVQLFGAIADFFTKNNISVFENLTLNFVEVEKINNLKFDRVMSKLTAMETAYLRPLLLKSTAISDVVFNDPVDVDGEQPSVLGLQKSSSSNAKLKELLFSELLNLSTYIKRPNVHDRTKMDYQKIYSEEQINEYIKRVNELLG